MNPAHLHLILNHFPVVTAVCGLPLFLVALARRNGPHRDLALGIFIASAVLAVPAYVTGGRAEGVVEGLAGVSEEDIERHEEAADIAALVVGAQGITALAALFVLRRRAVLPARLTSTLLVLSLAGALLMARAANLGGRIRHSEVRPAAAAGGHGGPDCAPPRFLIWIIGFRARWS